MIIKLYRVARQLWLLINKKNTSLNETVLCTHTHTHTHTESLYNSHNYIKSVKYIERLSNKKRSEIKQYSL